MDLEHEKRITEVKGGYDSATAGGLLYLLRLANVKF